MKRLALILALAAPAAFAQQTTHSFQCRSQDRDLPHWIVNLALGDLHDAGTHRVRLSVVKVARPGSHQIRRAAGLARVEPLRTVTVRFSGEVRGKLEATNIGTAPWQARLTIEGETDGEPMTCSLTPI